MSGRNERGRYAVTRSEKRGRRGTWFRGEGRQEAVLSCPKCGATADLLETHDVQTNGDVVPSVVCSCGFHEHVTLEGWGSVPKYRARK